MNQIDAPFEARPSGLAADPTLVAQLKALLGPDQVLTEMAERVFYSTDIFTQGLTAEAVIRPTSVASLSQAVGLCTTHGHAVIPRGGGFSYTQGYVPVRAGTVMVDLQALDSIVEINAEDLYVTVECGCTWVALYEALKSRGFRTPYFGPMSGYRATVGGALSQGSFFLGSTQYGTSADSVLGLQVVLADGTLLTTGSAASTIESAPTFRNFGPDLTGLFLNDSGALGLKARATLKLIPTPPHTRFGTFAFEDVDSCLAALSEIGRRGSAAECYIWDPVLAENFAARNSLGDDLKYLKGVVRAGSSLFDGLKSAARMAASGKSVFNSGAFILHVTMDDLSAAGAEERLKMVQAVVAERGGGEVEASAPRAMRGTPFINFVPTGEAALPDRNLPVHGLFPHSRIAQVTRDVYAYIVSQKPLLDQNDIRIGVIYFAVGANTVCIEPLLYWKDEQLALHSRLHGRSDLAALARFSGRPPAGQAVAQLRAELVALFKAAGASHVQIGKAYPYRETRQPATYQLLQAIKDAVDPDGLINPGSLGLGSG